MVSGKKTKEIIAEQSRKRFFAILKGRVKLAFVRFGLLSYVVHGKFHGDRSSRWALIVELTYKLVLIILVLMDSVEIQAPILAIPSDLQIATDKTTKDKNSL